MDKVLLRVEEAAQALSIGRSKAFELIRDEQLRTVRIGRSLRVPADAVREFVERMAEK